MPQRRARRLWTAVAAWHYRSATLTALPTTTDAAAVECSVDYKTNDWGSGFTANLTITKRDSTAIDGWTLTYTRSGNQKLANGWKAIWSQSGKAVTAKCLSYNAKIAPGAAATAGAQFTYSGANAAPTDF